MMEDSVRVLLRGVGEDLDREGLRDTPKRVAKAWREMCSCTSSNPADAIGNALFAEPLLCIPSTSDRVQSGPVLVRDVDFASTCANSLLPFYGRAHAAYAPGAGVVVGLSKVARLVHHLSKRITTPRELARDAAAVLQRESGALGAVVVLSFRRLGTFDGSPAREEVVVERTGCFPGPHSPAWAEFRCMLALAGVSLPEEQPFADGINAGKSSERSSVSSDTMPIESGPGAPSQDGRSTRCPESCREDVSLHALDSGSLPDSGADSDSPRGQTWPRERWGSAGVEAACSSGRMATPEGIQGMEEAVVQLLEGAGARGDLQGAARGFVKRLVWMTRGYRTEITGGARRQRGGGCGRGAVRARALGGGVWECAGPAMGFESLCEHHMLPFHGRVMAVVAVREGAGNAEETWAAVESAVEKYACRLQIQERLTEQVAEEVMGVEGAEGCVVVVDSAHMCMVARGVERFAASTVTSAYRGVYAADARARSAAVGRLLE